MKTNIINTLIIAIILIAGWSLFIIIQDFNTSSSVNYPNYGVISKGKQYLPKAPENYSKQHNYPVYKGQQQGMAKSTYINNKPAIVSKNSNYDVSESTSSLKYSDVIVSMGKTNIDSKKDLVDASTPKKNYRNMLISTSTGLLKAFISDNEGGGGNENQVFFIEIPIGDGFYLLLMMLIIYVLMKFRKNIKLYVSSQIK
ncbi:MAG: hypothetical protein Q7J05_00910 [Paludibacter sp.]|nr:hypothetical protein [Paludibacter sp.]